MRRVRAPMDPAGELLSDKHWPVPDLYYYPPDKFVAIHREKLIYLGAGEPGLLWQSALKVATPKQLVFGTTTGILAPRVYDSFTEEQLETLWLNTVKAEYTGEDIRVDCINLGSRIKAFTVPSSMLAYDPENPPAHPSTIPISTPIPKGVQGKKVGGSTLTPTTHERPLQGTKTGTVWAVADDCFAKFPNMTKKQLKEEVTRGCVKLGINPSTAQVQFGKWMASQKALTI